MCIIYCFFFFKQKTAYEVRISDWSSDVCSSDLHVGASGGTVSWRGNVPACTLVPAGGSAGVRHMIKELRAWARVHTERDRYSPVGIAFHWIMALLILFQLGWGWYMSRLPVGGDKLHAYEVHSAEIGRAHV